MDLDKVVLEHLAALFRFAWALTGDETTAVELAQKVLADSSWHGVAGKVEVALFSAAYRGFTRGDLLPVPPVHDRVALLTERSLQHARELTSTALLQSFLGLELPQRAALVLFYTTPCMLSEIAAILLRTDEEAVAMIARAKGEWLHILQQSGGETP